MKANPANNNARKILARIYSRQIGDPDQGKVDAAMLKAAMHAEEIAGHALMVIVMIAQKGIAPFLSRSPSSSNRPASNAICRKAGFTLVGETDIEYPPGSIMRCNEWRLGL